MAIDWRITTWASKVPVVDKNDMADLTSGEGDYVVICLTPQSRFVILSLLAWWVDYYNRWHNFSGQREIDQLYAEAFEGVSCEMACSEDIQALVAAVQGMGLTLIEIRDRLGDVDGDLDTRLTEVKVALETIDTTVAALDHSSLYDQIEPILSGVGVILGAPSIP